MSGGIKERFDLKGRWSEAKFKEFEPRLKFETWLKNGLNHLKLYSMFQDLSQRSIETGFYWIWDNSKSLSLDPGQFKAFSCFSFVYLCLRWSCVTIHFLFYIWPNTKMKDRKTSLRLDAAGCRFMWQKNRSNGVVSNCLIIWQRTHTQFDKTSADIITNKTQMQEHGDNKHLKKNTKIRLLSF